MTAVASFEGALLLAAGHRLERHQLEAGGRLSEHFCLAVQKSPSKRSRSFLNRPERHQLEAGGRFSKLLLYCPLNSVIPADGTPHS